jgi:AraC-like DNA-binding protein
MRAAAGPTRSSRVTVERSENGDWELARAEPPAELRPFIRRYEGFTEKSAAPLVRRELPSRDVVMIVNFGAPYDVSAPGQLGTPHAGSFVAPLSSVPANVGFSGVAHCLQIDFTPLGAHRFLGLPLDELPPPAIGLGDLLGREGERLTAQLHDAGGWAERFDLLDAAIAGRLGATRAPSPSVEWAWAQLVRSDGTAPVGSLAERLGCSRRHLIAGFREQIGVPPKTAARIMRFEHATRAIRADPRGSLARVAADCGYYDQAHMNRDFRELAGMAPGTFAASIQPGFLGIAEERVNSVQAAGGRRA